MSLDFSFCQLPLDGLVRIDRKVSVDSRGFFSRIFCAEQFKEIGVVKAIAQMNHTLTTNKGTIRGMHFQHFPHSETKIVSCIQGEILDVAVDIRKGSPTFLHWHAEVLSEENQCSLYIPEGFAHGFQALADDCRLLYMHTKPYAPDAEGALNALDPLLAIDWPLAVTAISGRDRSHPMLDSRFTGVDVP